MVMQNTGVPWVTFLQSSRTTTGEGCKSHVLTRKYRDTELKSGQNSPLSGMKGVHSMCCHLAWQDAAVMNSVDLHAMKKERVAGMLADDDTVYLKNAAKLPWPKHLQLCMSSWYSCAWDMQVQSENTPKQHCSCLECRQNSQNCFHLQFFCYSSSLVQNLRVLFDHNIWVQPPLYPGAMMGRGIGDEVSAWGHVQAARLPKGCCAGG